MRSLLLIILKGWIKLTNKFSYQLKGVRKVEVKSFEEYPWGNKMRPVKGKLGKEGPYGSQESRAAKWREWGIWYTWPCVPKSKMCVSTWYTARSMGLLWCVCEYMVYCTWHGATMMCMWVHGVLHAVEAYGMSYRDGLRTYGALQADPANVMMGVWVNCMCQSPSLETILTASVHA